MSNISCSQHSRKATTTRRPDDYDAEAALLDDEEDGGPSNPGEPAMHITGCPAICCHLPKPLNKLTGKPRQDHNTPWYGLVGMAWRTCLLSNRLHGITQLPGACRGPVHAAPKPAGRGISAADERGSAAARAAAGGLGSAADRPCHLHQPALAAGGAPPLS